MGYRTAHSQKACRHEIDHLTIPDYSLLLLRGDWSTGRNGDLPYSANSLKFTMYNTNICYTGVQMKKTWWSKWFYTKFKSSWPIINFATISRTVNRWSQGCKSRLTGDPDWFQTKFSLLPFEPLYMVSLPSIIQNRVLRPPISKFLHLSRLFLPKSMMTVNRLCFRQVFESPVSSLFRTSAIDIQYRGLRTHTNYSAPLGKAPWIPCRLEELVYPASCTNPSEKGEKNAKENNTIRYLRWRLRE